jgi:hypothetical protein
MAFNYDINRIFEELEAQAREEMELSNFSIESPEDALEPQDISKTTKYTHGGDKTAKEIKDLPNSADCGENSDRQSKSKTTQNNGDYR